MKIKDIGDLIGGQVISRIEAKPSVDEVCGKIKIIVPKSIKKGELIHDDLVEINLKTNIDKNKLTQKGDIVLKLSQPYDAAYISENDEGILITSFCLLLRNLKKEITPEYLVTLINSELYKEQAMSMTSGATIPMLTKGIIGEVEFDIFPVSEQKKIIQMSKTIKRKEEVFKEIILLEKLKLENILRGEN